LANAPNEPPQHPEAPSRIGDIPKAINSVLARAAGPMHTITIHRAVEQHLGRSVSYRTIKACLSADLRSKEPTFQRVAWGEYRLVR
jgi:hypothetical protein